MTSILISVTRNSAANGRATATQMRTYDMSTQLDGSPSGLLVVTDLAETCRFPRGQWPEAQLTGLGQTDQALYRQDRRK